MRMSVLCRDSAAHTGIARSDGFASVTALRLFFASSALRSGRSLPFIAIQLAIRPCRSLHATKNARFCGSFGAMSPESIISSWRIIVPLSVAKAGGSGTGPGFPWLAPRPRWPCRSPAAASNRVSSAETALAMSGVGGVDFEFQRAARTAATCW